MPDNTTSTAMTSEQARAAIEEQYKYQLDAQKAKTKGAYDQSVNTYTDQKDKADETYQPMRNQAYTENAMAEQARKENMANMGLSGAGGTSQTLQQRNQTSLLSTLGDVNRQQQDYTDNINLALSNLDTQYKSDDLALEQQNQADLNAALTAYDQWRSGYDLSNQEYELSQSNSAFDQAWALLQKKRITKDQFEVWTGIKLRR
jgi:hypothetical protein